jgi:hypothetical protein
VRICRVGAPSSSAVGIEEDERMGHFWTVEVDGGLQFSGASEFRFDVSEIPYSSIQNASLLNGYARPVVGTGPFSAVTTAFDGDELVVTGVERGAPGARAFVQVAEITFGGDTGALPVELTAFEAALDGADVLLAWETAGETNNAGFDVEMAVLGEDRAPAAFASMGFVEGAGTTAQAQRYAFRFADVAPGTYRFRLRQVDLDGTATLTSEIEASVEITQAFALSAARPNPFTQATRFDLAVRQAQEVRVAVYDVLGREVVVLHNGPFEAQASKTLTLDGADLAAGAYVVRVLGERFDETMRVTVVR